MSRKAMKDVILNDGTFIPWGTMVVAAAEPTHHDDLYYPDATIFDPFRFARMREGEGESTKHQFVNTSTEYVSFGHGKHAWCVHIPSYSTCGILLFMTVHLAPVGSSPQTS